jgi:Holliday junction DNA helicase RuvA
MIGYLKGKLILQKPEYIILDVNGVGYKVEIILGELSTDKQTEIELWIHTVVREDDIRLFGFQNNKELELFELLLTVSGVGPKSAQGMLNYGFDNVVSGIITGELKSAKVSGIGKKTLEKIVIEIQDKIEKKLTIQAEEYTRARSKRIIQGNNFSTQKGSDLIEALTVLGYNRNEAERIIANTADDLTGDLSKDIKIVLQGKRY